jgi:hypothetical protein
VAGKQGLPRLLVVIRTLRPYDAAALRSSLKAREHPSSRGRQGDGRVYMFQQELLPLYTQGMLTCPDDRTLVLGWQVPNVAEMPTGPPSQGNRLPGAITDLLANRGKPAGPVWLAGHSDDWTRPLLLLLELKQVSKPDRDLLAKVRTFSAWLELHDKDRPTFRGVIRCADASGAELVAQSVRDRLKDEKGLVVVRKDEWIDIQYRQQR